MPCPLRVLSAFSSPPPPPSGSSGTAPPADTQYVAPVLKRLITVIGTEAAPVTGIAIRGLGVRDAAATYMEPWGVPSGGDCKDLEPPLVVRVGGGWWWW